MRCLPAGVLVSIVLPLFFIGAPVSVSAQSANELRQENERLRARVAELDSQLQRATRRISRLETEIRKLRQSRPGAEAPEGTPRDGNDPGEVSADLPEDPFSAPDSMYQALHKEYEQELGAEPRETAAEIGRFKRKAQGWARKAALRHRKPVQWLLRVIDMQPGEGRQELVVTLAVLNQQTRQPIGVPFDLTVNRRETARFEDAGKNALVEIAGVFAAKPRYDAEAEASGVFNVPRLVGPYVVFDFDLSINSLQVIQEIEE